MAGGRFPDRLPQLTGCQLAGQRHGAGRGNRCLVVHHALPSGVFTYAFYRDCPESPAQPLRCTGFFDPANPPWNTPVVPPASTEPTSQVYVPSDPAFGTIDYSWQATNRVHGTLADVTYPTALSTNPPGYHPLAVYTPPGYDPNRAVPYPTLYLSHGAGGNEVYWSTQGVAGKIIDNLIAPGGSADGCRHDEFNGISVGLLVKMFENVIPYVG
jgi:hypothetical protein